MEARKWMGLGLSLLLAFAIGACGQPSGAPSSVEAPAEGTSGDILPPTEEAPLSKVPNDTFVDVTIGEPESLDPAWTYETTGSMIELNIYDGLIYFDREKPDAFVPNLAEGWEVSDDKLAYSFNLRKGVKFHAGGTLEASDIAYSLHRAMLQDRVDGPMTLFLNPLLGASTIEGYALDKAGISTDVAEGEKAPTLDDVSDADARQVCEDVKATVVADDAAGTVTIKVKQPTPWMPQLLSQPWGSALDKAWMIEQKDWDDSCDTWRQWHDPTAEESVLFDKANGTGPYKLGEWKKGQEITLEANEDYWRTEPAWDGGPSGPAKIKHVVIQKVEEWGTRFAKLSAGEADIIVVPRANIDQVEPMIHTQYDGGDENAASTVVNPAGTLKLFKGYATLSAEAGLFSLAINPASEFIGSGKLDGEGVNADFFSDIHVRKGFNHCFDWDTYIKDALKNEGFQTRGPIIDGLQGYKGDSEVYSFDLKKCEEELVLAWDGKLPTTGFKLTLAYNKGSDSRRTAAEILADSLAQVNPKYLVKVQELEWPTFLDARKNGNLPVSFSGWLADYHDASNWVDPFMAGTGAYARAQKFPEELQKQIDEQIAAGLAETDDAKRDAIYAGLQKMAIDNAIDIFLTQATGRFYVSRQTKGWYHNPLAPGLNFYVLSKE